MDKILNDFVEFLSINSINANTVPLNNKSIDNFIFSNYKVLSEKMKNIKRPTFIYTVVKEEEGIYIVENYHYNNRIGYIVSYKKYNKFPIQGIRLGGM